jgi:actin-related protein
MIGKEDNPNLYTLPATALKTVDEAIKPLLLRNVILSGGTTLLPGLKERLHKELALQLATTSISIHAQPNRAYLAYTGTSSLFVSVGDCTLNVVEGASLQASLSTFPDLCLSRAEYQEGGAERYLKC